MGSLFEVLMQFLTDLFQWFGNCLVNLFIDLINAIILLIGAVLGTMLAVLPQHDISFVPPAELMVIAGQLNWFFPFASLVACLTVLAIAYGGYFAVRPVLKFFQMT